MCVWNIQGVGLHKLGRYMVLVHTKTLDLNLSKHMADPEQNPEQTKSRCILLNKHLEQTQDRPSFSFLGLLWC